MTRHCIDRFAERALPAGWYWPDYLHWALRDLAERPVDWARLQDSAPLYVVIGRFLCLPLQAHHARPGCWEPTPVVNEDAGTWSWPQPLEHGRVRLPQRPPRPPDVLAPAELTLARAAAGQRAQQMAAAIQRPGGTPLTPGRWRAWRAWRTERERQRAASLEAQLNQIEHTQAQGRQALERWKHELMPAYQSTWQAVYRQRRAEGPRVVPAASAPTPASGGRPAWWRGPA